MEEFNHRDKALLRRENELELQQKRILDERVYWNERMCVQKEQLQKKFERDRAQFEDALMNVTQKELSQLVEEHEAYKRALLAVLAVFHIKCIAFDLEMLCQLIVKEETSEPMGATSVAASPSARTQTNARSYEALSIVLYWMASRIERSNQSQRAENQSLPSVEKPLVSQFDIKVETNEFDEALVGGFPHFSDGYIVAHSPIRYIFISVLTLEAVLFIGKCIFHLLTYNSKIFSF